jgi:uncharacterized protein
MNHAPQVHPEPCVIVLGSVHALYRYPVKSMLGESLQSVPFESRGLSGDRLWAVEDDEGKFGSGKSTRRFRRMEGLLQYSARYVGDQPLILTPDGRDLLADGHESAADLSARIGRHVRITREDKISHFDEGPVHLLTTSALHLLGHLRGQNIDPSRLRCNVLLQTPTDAGHIESTWIGRQVSLGPSVRLEIVKPMPRCVMVDMAQRNLEADGEILKAITRADSNVCFGVLTTVLIAGEVRVGDEMIWDRTE